jgi:hypothetical protein
MQLIEKAINALAKTTPEALASGPPLSRFQAYILWSFSPWDQRSQLPKAVKDFSDTSGLIKKEQPIYKEMSRMSMGLSQFQLPDMNGGKSKHNDLWDAYLVSVCEAALQLTRNRNQTIATIKKEVENTCAGSVEAIIHQKYRGTVLEPHMRTFLLGVTTSALAEFIPDVTSYPEK